LAHSSAYSTSFSDAFVQIKKACGIPDVIERNLLITLIHNYPFTQLCFLNYFESISKNANHVNLLFFKNYRSGSGSIASMRIMSTRMNALCKADE
jgi:hypothetical protein